MSMNGAKLHKVGKTIFIALPVEARRTIDGGCVCDYCKAHPDKAPMWDTLAVSEDGKGTAWTVHYPKLA